MSLTHVVIGNESLLIGCSEMLLDRGHRIAAVISHCPHPHQIAADTATISASASIA